MSETAPPPRPEHRPAAGVAVSGLSYFMVSIGDALSKLLVATFPVGQLLSVRGAFALLFLAPAFLWTWRKGRAVFATRRLPLHALRAAVMLVSTFTFFAALRHIDLAKITAIMFLMPVFVALFSGPLAGEKVASSQWAAIGLGFAGTIVVLEPGFDGISFAEAMALFSAMTWAVNLLMLRRLAATESPITVIGLFYILAMPAYIVLGLFDWRPLDGESLFLIAAMAALHLAGLWLGAHAFRLARAATVAPVQYSQIVWASVFGWVIWRQTPGWSLLAGSLLIVIAGLVLVFAGRPKPRP